METNRSGSLSKPTIAALGRTAFLITVIGGIALPFVMYMLVGAWGDAGPDRVVRSIVGACIALGMSVTALVISAALSFLFNRRGPAFSTIGLAIVTLLGGVTLINGLIAQLPIN